VPTTVHELPMLSATVYYGLQLPSSRRGSSGGLSAP